MSGMIIGNPITLGGGGKSKLPEGYTQLAYIESTGTQYINTGFWPNQDTRVVFDYELTGSEENPALFGAWTAANQDMFIFVGLRSSGGGRAYYNTVTSDGVMDFTGRHTIDYNKNVVTFDGDTLTSFEAATFSTAYTLLLCAYNHIGNAQLLANLRLYSCKIYDNGTLVRNFVPCGNASGEVGLYDLVNNVFYGNAGSGTFYPPCQVEEAPVLLWTNASPTSAFAAQTINVDYSQYDAILIENVNANWQQSNVKVVSLYNPSQTIAQFLLSQNEVSTAGYIGISSRKVTFANSNQINFESAKIYQTNSTSTASGNYAIPTRIWGVKFTLE